MSPGAPMTKLTVWPQLNGSLLPGRLGHSLKSTLSVDPVNVLLVRPRSAVTRSGP